MNNSIFWAKLLGFYAVITSIWSFYNIKHLFPLVISLVNNPLILMTLGLFTLFIGLAIVTSHSVWKGWPIVVTIIGYWIAFKGIILLFFPLWINQVLVFWAGKNLLTAPLPALIIGLILLYCGFFVERKTN